MDQQSKAMMKLPVKHVVEFRPTRRVFRALRIHFGYEILLSSKMNAKIMYRLIELYFKY